MHILFKHFDQRIGAALIALIIPGWKTFSLRARMGALLGGMFLAALTAGLLLLWIFSSDQILEENEPSARSAINVAAALNAALKASANPDETLRAFVDHLDSEPANPIRFRSDGDALAPDPDPTPGKVPKWFVHSLLVPDLAKHIPIMVHGRRVGDLIFEPDLSAQIYEKWIGFLSLLASSIALASLAALMSFVTIGAALRPLRDLSEGLARLRSGNFSKEIDCSGPPEIRESCLAVNELAKTLNHLNSENRGLLRRMVSIQDEERRDISRELHDELGPLLFAIRANVIAMIDGDGDGENLPDVREQRVLQAVEALQITNRRILERLRPLLIEELGLDASIQKLVRDVHAQVPDMVVTMDIDPKIASADAIVAQTVYRVLQESITNVLKHAGASVLKVRTEVANDAILVEIADNGATGPSEPKFGRGLTGMRERLRALDGTFQYARADGWTTIRCSLPLVAKD
jgi:two-component system sensor histidine kinase UhpB